MRLSSAVAAVALAAASLVAVSPAVQADSPKISETTVVGVHNTYDPGQYAFLAQALDAGSSLIELDVWPDVFTHEWKVSHDSLTSNKNNCVNASTAADLYTGGANKDLESCLDDIRVWLDAHPGKGPITIKLEMKTGFSANNGLGPAQLDASFRGHLAGHVFRPVDLLGGYATLDDAAKANNWPTRASMAGKVFVEAIPGTVEEGNPTDTLHTDVEEAQYLQSLQSSGHLGDGQVFPTEHGAVGGDPRDKYAAALRPWFVFFDGDASGWVNDTGPSWYDTNHYFVVMTDAQNVAPAIDDRNPTVDQATQRVTDLAHQHASVVTSDWVSLNTVLPLVLPRG
ncbi:phosphatidylinositol-specific phospholipase C domain-containing protein [Fodinicola feengrottensis]|uniref:Phosphatidylinositol-specific phospholipase C domain-containing protein n=1 Tax=Fodinicola feengrottensis TaxID=435914 RepID=A0ABN2G8I3_9ACTN